MNKVLPVGSNKLKMYIHIITSPFLKHFFFDDIYNPVESSTKILRGTKSLKSLWLETYYNAAQSCSSEIYELNKNAF